MRKTPGIKLSRRQRPLFGKKRRFASQAIRMPKPKQRFSMPSVSPRLEATQASRRPSVRRTPVTGPRQALRWALVSAAVFCTSAWPVDLHVTTVSQAELWGITKSHFARALAESDSWAAFSPSIDIAAHSQISCCDVNYTIDPELQSAVAALIKRYNPDYAAFVALEPRSGRVLAMYSHMRDGRPPDNLATKASFPAASVIKIVTAAAAIDEGKVRADTVVPYNGKNSSLYKRQVFDHKDNKWTRRVSLRTAFARSVNTVFGRLGVFEVGANGFMEYARRFGFNGSLHADFPVEMGTIEIKAGDDWSLVEAASGYTRNTTMSPMQGAMMAAVVANDGIAVEPFLIQTANDEYGIEVYQAGGRDQKQVMTQDTAQQLKLLMRETVRTGSARKSFRGFFKRSKSKPEVGGKTGSLTGLSPRGKNDWFVGYGRFGDKEIAFAALTINIEKWRVKSAYIARKALETYFKPNRDSS